MKYLPDTSLAIAAWSMSLLAFGQGGITAPLPDTGDLTVQFKLIATIPFNGTAGSAHFAEAGSQLYTDKYISDEQDCRPCQGTLLRNVVSGNVIKTTDDLIVSAYSKNAGFVLGEDLSSGLFGRSYHESIYSLHGGLFSPIFRMREGKDGKGKFSGDNRYFAGLSSDGSASAAVYLRIALFDLQKRKQTADLVADDNINSISFSDDSQHVLAACADGTVRVWNAATGAPLHTFDVGAGSVSWAVELSNQGAILAEADKLIKLDSKSGRVVASAPIFGDDRSLAVSSDGRLLAAFQYANSGREIVAFSTETLSAIATIWDSGASPSDAKWNLSYGTFSFSADNSAFLASGGVADDESVVRVWRIERGQ